MVYPASKIKLRIPTDRKIIEYTFLQTIVIKFKHCSLEFFFFVNSDVYLDDVKKQISKSSLLLSSSTCLPRYTQQFWSSHNKGIFLLSSIYDLARSQHTRNQWICTLWFVDLFYLVPFIGGDGAIFSPLSLILSPVLNVCQY